MLGALDFSNEPYVRLYCRDSATWKRLGFEGQTVLMHLLRRANYEGVIDLAGIEPWEAAAILCDAPEPLARAGVARLIELGCATLSNGKLVFPRYEDAQNAAASDAKRAADFRARKALANPDTVTKRDSASHNVTSHDDVTVWDPVFGARRRMPGPEPAQAARAAAWLSQATGLEPYSHSGKWLGPLLELAGKPDAEKSIAARVLRQQAMQPEAASILTPRHVVDYWPTYRTGAAPGGGKRNGNGNGHAAARVNPPEIDAARAESDRCKQQYERARTVHEREAAQKRWLAADHQLKQAKEKHGWNS